MKYFKSSQPMPGKGLGYTYYECDESHNVNRYVTFIPATGETKRVADPVVKKLYHPESLMEATEEEFRRHWPDGVEEGANTQETGGAAAPSADGAPADAWGYINPGMTVAEAMSLHPRAGEVFAAFNLGACGYCGISGYETIGQVCAVYGVDVNTLIEVLEELIAQEQEASQSGENP